MQVDVALVPDEMEHCSQPRIAVVIDVLRASTTITTALDHGARFVATFATVEQALKWRQEDEGRLLGGERGALPIQGFSLGNSPLEYTKEVVFGQQIGLSTTNGTFAVKMALERADIVLVGSLLNVGAVVEYCRGGEDLLLVCAGTHGRLSLEDAFCAGMILTQSGLESTTDSARVAKGIFEQYSGSDPVEFLGNTKHGMRLKELGFHRDLAYCAKVDSSRVVPHWSRTNRAFVA